MNRRDYIFAVHRSSKPGWFLRAIHPPTGHTAERTGTGSTLRAENECVAEIEARLQADPS